MVSLRIDHKLAALGELEVAAIDEKGWGTR